MRIAALNVSSLFSPVAPSLVAVRVFAVHDALTAFGGSLCFNAPLPTPHPPLPNLLHESRPFFSHEGTPWEHPTQDPAISAKKRQRNRCDRVCLSMDSFWEGLPKPFFIQAPMEDVTDAAFRALIARFGKPHVMFTEFTSADGLVLAPEGGRKILLKKLLYSPEERPVVAQLFTAYPAHMEAAAKLCAELGFDGIDINMGCPVDDVVKTGCGAALIKNPALARELIRAAQKSGLPVSVKTRIGYDKNTLDEWLPELLAENLAAITLHARTRKEMSDVPAHWDAVARAVAIRDRHYEASPHNFRTLIVGNGDVKNLEEARSRVEETGCDGVMLGRAIYGNPWLYEQHRKLLIQPQEKINALIEHIKLFDKLLGDTSNFATMKKHFKAYISGWDGAKDLRVWLMETNEAGQALEILASYPQN